MTTKDLFYKTAYISPYQQQHTECIFSEFKILSGQLKHNKTCSEKKLGKFYAILYDLFHYFNNSIINNEYFRMFNKCNLTGKMLKYNSQIVILKADKGTSMLF